MHILFDNEILFLKKCQIIEYTFKCCILKQIWTVGFNILHFLMTIKHIYIFVQRAVRHDLLNTITHVQNTFGIMFINSTKIQILYNIQHIMIWLYIYMVLYMWMYTIYLVHFHVPYISCTLYIFTSAIYILYILHVHKEYFFLFIILSKTDRSELYELVH